MSFRLQITHSADDEAGLLAFITHIKDNYSTVAVGASADSENKHCLATLDFPTLNDVVAAVQDMKTNFTIKYRMNYQP
jgi:hypothetical protein